MCRDDSVTWFECTKIENCREGTKGKRSASYVLTSSLFLLFDRLVYFHLALYGISTRACMYNICMAYPLDRDSRLVLRQRKSRCLQVVLLTSPVIGMVHCDVVCAKLGSFNSSLLFYFKTIFFVTIVDTKILLVIESEQDYKMKSM